jgi:hypothetical protein
MKVAKAKTAPSEMRKVSPNSHCFTASKPVGLVLWSEMEDEGMFKQALPALCGLPEAERSSFLERLNHLRSKARRFGWG